MTSFFRSQYANVGAAAMAAIVTFGLVTAPPTSDPVVVSLTRVEVVAVQLQAEVSDFVQTATTEATAPLAPISLTALYFETVVSFLAPFL